MVKRYCLKSCKAIGDERGQALVELAVTAPLLLFVMLAVVGLAQAGQKKAMVARAAAVAARVAVVRPDLADDAAGDFVKQSDPKIRAEDIKVELAALSGPRVPFSQPMRVRVTVTHRPLTGFGWKPIFYLSSEYVVDRWSNAVWFDVR